MDMQIGNTIRVYDTLAPGEYVDCMLAQVGECMVCAICIDSGNRWAEPVKVRHAMLLTPEDMDNILGKGACYDLLKEVKLPAHWSELRAKLKSNEVPF